MEKDVKSQAPCEKQNLSNSLYIHVTYFKV